MRYMFRTCLVCICLLTGLAMARSASPESSKTILDSAARQAVATKRNVFVIFHASWCVWCRRLDSVLAVPEVHTLIEKNLVVVHLDVMERGEKKALENPGAQEEMNDLGGANAGLPFYAFLDANGKVIANSIAMKGKTENIGFPGSDEERAAFRKLLMGAAPRMRANELAMVMRHFGG